MSKLNISLADTVARKIRPDFSYFLLLIFGFSLGLFFLLKYPIKLDEPLILDYLYFGVVQPDHYSLFYLFIRPIAWLFGDSTASLRILPFLFFLASIHVFHKYLTFLFSSKKLAAAGVLLLLLNSFFLNISIYAYEYSLYFLAAITSLFLFEKFLASGKNLGWLAVINMIGLATFTMFYHVLAAELIMLLFLPKTRSTKIFIFFNLAALATHFSLITTKLLNFRFNFDRPATLLDRRLIDFLGDAVGIDITSVFELQTILVAISVLGLIFYLVALFASRRRFYLLLFFLSVASFTLFKLMNLREIEYRYYFYLTPIFIISVLQLQHHLSLVRFRVALAGALLLNATGLLLFLGFVKYGENSDFLHRLEATDRLAGQSVLYTNNLWNYRHMVLPVYYRQFKKLPTGLDPQEVNSFTGLNAPKFFVLQFRPETAASVELPLIGEKISEFRFSCSRCDTDAIRLLEYKNHEN